MRADGRKGVRNLVLIVYTVECAQHVAHAIAREKSEMHVIGFPGCYDNQYAIRLMLALARHPNVGAVLAVGLGCEYTQPEKIAEAVRDSGRPAEWFFIQRSRRHAQERGTKGKQIAARLRERDSPRNAARADDAGGFNRGLRVRRIGWHVRAGGKSRGRRVF